uniref:Rieske domain-containing protein n=1 Tax=Chaetoceros debilis TaxID=122233 RepID=A0A7S3PWA7_9STRA|mmetsp:Transcript_6754/g.9938  ORF Transcript_6754/g.9938 Transcript_6754/m.9938 type:complete len:212 (-) Transcript_6754:180-815(-)|eukprot:CAMPEP_0194083810 /NCGR_PEP_ID=MMETSP0149-20130528/9773_1 /TAXON_ID=122233 /ORGANISM="Chaetoceros debilis, Strain MM31A-1" /LENGTH=211 /DNA_ID=CAMNT_0038766265 /DNA_START=59 /DNA_END=694 /DNA_ORIENTATION=-
MPSLRNFTLLAFVGFLSANAFAPSTTTPSSTSLMMAKGRKSLRKTVKGASNARGVTPMADQDMGVKKTNWVEVKGLTSMDDLPKEENTVKMVDTMAEKLMNGATNPTGAIAVVNYEGKTYSFASGCACCQIPLAKAKILPPNDETGNGAPRISCDFCKATYNVRTGERLEKAEKPGLLGGIVTGLFSKSDKIPLPIYDLGEKSGQVLINLP